MTPDEAREALLRRPVRFRTPLAIRAHIYYEQQDDDGEPCSSCVCGRRGSKAYPCVLCLQEMLAVAEEDEGKSKK